MHTKVTSTYKNDTSKCKQIFLQSIHKLLETRLNKADVKKNTMC